MKKFVSRIPACFILIFTLMSATALMAQESQAPAPAADQPVAAEALEPSGALQPAQPEAAAASSATSPLNYLPDGGFGLIKSLGAFFLVLVLLFLTLKGLGRLGRFKGGRRGCDSFFELRGIQALDNRKYLAAVEVDGRIIVVGVAQDRITPVAQWIVDAEEDDLDLPAPKSPVSEPGLQFKLPEEEEDLPLDISVADHHSERPRK